MRTDIAKERVTQIYKYLEALCQHRNPVKRQVSEQPWILWLDSLVDHPAIKFAKFFSDEGQKTSILKVKRPSITVAPAPPNDLRDWIKNGWQDPFKKVEVVESINQLDGDQSITILFNDNLERARQLNEWICRRDLWAQAECPAREAMKVYERIYDLYMLIQKESEKYRIILGDGILNWRRPEGGINHPILLQRIELEFDADRTEFSFEETNEPSELYGALFASLEDVDGSLLAYHRNDIENNNYSPLGEDVIDSFFRRFISQLSVHGEFIAEGTVEGELDSPRIFRKPCIFLQDRSGGLLVSIKSIIEHIQENQDLPCSLRSIAGVEEPSLEDVGLYNSQVGYCCEPKEIYFGKPANLEQIKVAEVLDHNFGVLVQGPPGTGKTHTIANLLGHLLTQGKTVLVTSHTTKALRVLREKVAKELQALCVSVLDRDSQSQEEMKQSIESIVSQLSTIDEKDYIRKTDDMQVRREWILDHIEKLQQKLIESRSTEFQSIVIAGQEYSPRDAIQIVLAGRTINDWIPGEIETGSPIPLSMQEFNELYHYTHRLSTEKLSMIAADLPSLDCLPTEHVMTTLMEEERRLLAIDSHSGEEYWRPIFKEFDKGHHVTLYELLQDISSAVDEIEEASNWHREILQAGWKGKVYRQVWDNLVSDADHYVSKHALFKSEIYKYQPEFITKSELHKLLQLVNEIVDHLKTGGTLGRFTLLMHPSWSSLRKNITVNNKMLSTLDEFIFIRDYIVLQLEGLNLVQRWNGCMKECNGLLLDFEGNFAEVLPQVYPVILKKLNWYDVTWKKHEDKLIEMGFCLEDLLVKQPIVTGQSGEFIRFCQTLSGPLKEVLNVRVNRYQLEEVKRSLSTVEEYVQSYCQSKSCDIGISLQTAIKNRSPLDYKKAIDDLHHTIEVNDMAAKRQILLNKLTVYAPQWAKKIEKFDEQEVAEQPPGDIEKAWLWKQLNQELVNRGSISLDEIQKEIELQKTDLYAITNQLISNRAWLHQKRRVKLRQQQALMGYLDVTRRIGRGTGKRVPEFQKEARRLMSECRSAVPVWIMPLTRVAETFSPTQTKFDVVIIDEASQCDLMGLIAMYLAKKVIVVGDHEQVSPLSVGQNSAIISNLISQFLQGIPNAILYDGKASIYDLARSSFGGILSLTEHFRCVPEIIQFSNRLCYNTKLKPLRESNSSQLKPATVSYRVMGASRDGKTNEQEAIAIASLVVAACQLPIYKEKTMGVISLLGDEQAMLIERHLRNHLTDEEYSSRRIICGNSAHFQGDERDIIFLSVVDATDSPPLAMRQDGTDGMYKKRFNVAASRACEQMWVVHSLNVKTDLKPGDIRRELIEHAENPLRYETEFDQLVDLTESPFEKEVLKSLVHNGYKVVPQWKVGYYRIDMVAVCGDKKVAIECDGERFHALDKLKEDMERQAVLERLGWKFIRIRGSQYYLDSEKTMEFVFKRLHELEVYPTYIEEELTMIQDNEIVETVIRNADVLKRTWSGEEEVAVIQSLTNNEICQSVEVAPVKKIRQNPFPIMLPNKVVELSESKKNPPIILPEKESVLPLSPKEIKINLLTAKQDDVKWIREQGYKVWSRLAKWGQETEQMNSKYCNLAKSLSKSVINETEIADYQAAKGKQMLEKAIRQGFS